MAPIEESVTIHRRLAESNPGHLPYLASPLNNLGHRLTLWGIVRVRTSRGVDLPGALAAAEEMVAIYELLSRCRRRAPTACAPPAVPSPTYSTGSAGATRPPSDLANGAN